MENEATYRHFITDIIENDIALGSSRVQTRFPPEPNGYLHIGHAKAICLDFGMAQRYGGICNLRFDDTNPSKEDVEYVDAIMEDITWLGFKWNAVYYASDYFDALYENALKLIELGKAFVCDLTAEQIRAHRGTLTEPGQNSPYRERPVEENLELFKKMRAGEFADGSRVLRAKIDMASPNLNMRDPVMYRIMHAHHHRTGDKWPIYPMYDYAHPLSDALEGVTHSLCTLEFEDHRPLYDWFLNELGFENPPRQSEFARLNLTRTIMSKRYLKKLVDEKLVAGWDDPRMPTLCGMRRRGYTPVAIRTFCERIGIAKSNSEVDSALLEHCLREELNTSAPRMMAVLDPLKITIENLKCDEQIELEFMPDMPELGGRTLTFSRELYIERTDFMEEPPKKFFRLYPGNEVRLKGAYIIKCESVVKDASGNVTELRCTYDPASKSGECERKVKGTLHWLSADDAISAKVRLYEPLLLEGEGDFGERMNPQSMSELNGCLVEKALADAAPGQAFQFIRHGYFCADADSAPDLPVFNRSVGLKDTWAKLAKQAT